MSHSDSIPGRPAQEELKGAMVALYTLYQTLVHRLPAAGEKVSFTLNALAHPEPPKDDLSPKN
jgi:hypothetical protein